jgi:hypothetical protein
MFKHFIKSARWQYHRSVREEQNYFENKTKRKNYLKTNFVTLLKNKNAF